MVMLDDAEAAKIVEQILTNHGFPVYCPDQFVLDVPDRELWNACVEIVRKLREHYIGPVIPYGQ